MENTWHIYHQQEEKFPYWLFIEQEKNSFLFLKAKDKWPGPGKNIFCLFEGTVKKNKLPKIEPIDECQIVSLRWYGKRLSIILDRPTRKRCWFVFIKKEYKQHPGTFYHQVFWITQSSSIAQKRGPYIPGRQTSIDYTILIDKNERHAYNFGNIRTEKSSLPSGDYAVRAGNQILAVVERKTKDNFLHDIAHLDVLRAKLEELDKLYLRKAMIIEASYKDLISPKNKFYSGSFIAKVLADLFAQFPGIQFIFFKGRKSANHWLFYYFQQVYARQKLLITND